MLTRRSGSVSGSPSTVALERCTQTRVPASRDGSIGRHYAARDPLRYEKAADVTAPDHDPLLFANDTLDGLLDFSEHAEKLSPAFGLVYRVDSEWRWMVLLEPEGFPQRTDGGPTVGDWFYVHIRRCDLSQIAAGIAADVDARGWLFTGTGWAVPGIPVEAIGRLAHHPQRQRVLHSAYLDQATGSIASRTQFLSTGEVDQRTMERPAAGWTLRNGGSIVAAMEMLRTAAAGACQSS